MLPCGLVLALSEFPLEYLREFLCAFAPSLQGACAYPTLPHNPPSFSKINLTFYTCFFFGFVWLSLLVHMRIPFVAAPGNLTCSLPLPSLLHLRTNLACEFSVCCRFSSQLAWLVCATLSCPGLI